MKRADIPDVEVVRAARDYAERLPWSPMVDELLVERTGASPKVAQAAIARALGRGLVACGVSERTCWPTTAGLEALGGDHTEGDQR